MPLRFIGGMTPAQLVIYLTNNYASWTETWITNATVINALAKYGLSFYLHVRDDPSNNEFNMLDGISSLGDNLNWWGVEAQINHIIPVGITIDAIYAEISTAPGAGTSRIFTLRDDGAAATTITFGAAITRVASTGLAVNIAAGSAIDWMHTLTGIPAAILWASLLIIYHIT